MGETSEQKSVFYMHFYHLLKVVLFPLCKCSAHRSMLQKKDSMTVMCDHMTLGMRYCDFAVTVSYERFR